jgi:hypothetical protein
MAEVGIPVEDKATAGWALCLKAWAPLDLTDARNRDPVPVASGTHQQPHIPQVAQRRIKFQGAGIELRRLRRVARRNVGRRDAGSQLVEGLQ